MMSEKNWKVVVESKVCPHRYPEMKESKWFSVCDSDPKVMCNFSNCQKKYNTEEFESRNGILTKRTREEL
ncbi:hypothetical protein LCGC14_3145310 [marine sediment metagenome]|uniref:Uncharacterized protein n=1 Tax=marine sediment metagenome TaxID=412755 RepID=A0A0F8YK19_9ZZZZ